MIFYLRKTVIAAISLYSAYTLIPTVNFGQDYKNVLLTVAAFVSVSLLVKPLFYLVLMPINFFTLTLVTFVLNALVAFALVFALPGFIIGAFDFPGLNIEGFIIPAYSFSQTITVLLFAALITLVQKLLHATFQ